MRVKIPLEYMNIWILGSSCLVPFASRVPIAWQKADIGTEHPSKYLELFQRVERHTRCYGATHTTLKQISIRDYMKPLRNTFSSPLTIKGDYSEYLQRKRLYCRQIKLVRWILTTMFFRLSSQWQKWWKTCFRQKALRMFLRSDQILRFSKTPFCSQIPSFETFTLRLHPLWAMLRSTDAAVHRSEILDFGVAGTNPLIALAIKIVAFSQRCRYCTGWMPRRWMTRGKTYHIVSQRNPQKII